MKVKCYFEVSTATMKRLASREKCKESKTSVTMVATLLQGGEKHKRSKRAVADAASTKEIEEALEGSWWRGHRCSWTQLRKSLTGNLVR